MDRSRAMALREGRAVLALAAGRALGVMPEACVPHDASSAKGRGARRPGASAAPAGARLAREATP
jgi:hypothetical protein